jgi:hypothetical protein
VSAEHGGRGGGWYTFGVLFAAAFSLALIVDQALIVAAGRHLVARIDAWLAALQPEPAPVVRGPLVDLAKLRDETGANGPAACETPSDIEPETPGA